MSIPQLKPSAYLVSGSSPLTHTNQWPDFRHQASRKLQEAASSQLFLSPSFICISDGAKLLC